MTPDAEALAKAWPLVVIVCLVFAALMAAGIAAWAVRWARLFTIKRRWARECREVRFRRLRKLAGADDPLLGRGGLIDDGEDEA